MNKPKYDPQRHHRRSIRLKGYDYAQKGLYFITICEHKRECRFGEVVAEEMILNEAGLMIEREWEALPTRFPQVQLHELRVMPNHFHGILEIKNVLSGDGHNVGAPLVGAPSPDGNLSQSGTLPSGERVRCHPGLGHPQGVPLQMAQTLDEIKSKKLGDMIDAFKSLTTDEYIKGVKNHEWPRFDGRLWQRNYYEHIIRNEESYNRISDYILNNPKNWKEDKLHPDTP